MARIRKPLFLDKYKLKKMISFLSTDAITQYTKGLTSCPFCSFLHDHLPQSLKFLPESYVLAEEKDIIGMITVTPRPGNPLRLSISRLFLEQNYFNAGKQLIEFVVSKHGAKGVNSFSASIDDSHNELLSLFIDGCGFRQCSSEQLWKMNTLRISETNNTFFRPFKNSDAQAVAMLFNDSVITHFKHSIEKTKKEYTDPLFEGLRNNYNLKYVIEDEKTKTIKGYFSLTTCDNQNYILDITTSHWYDCAYEDILNFTINQMSRRKHDFQLYIKTKKYTIKAEELEKFLLQSGFNCVQNQLILVKDFYKLVKEPQESHKILLFSEPNQNPVFKQFLKN
jgi:hypothetical protein